MDLNTHSARSSSSLEPIGGKLVLEHMYEPVKKLSSDGLFSTYRAIQQPFGRSVYIRFYRNLSDIGLSTATAERVTECIESGADVCWALDFGAVRGGSPFLVTSKPEGQLLSDWWQQADRTARQVASVGCAVVAAIEQLSVAQRSEVCLGRCYLWEDRNDQLQVELRCLGEFPTRAEVREIKKLVYRQLVVGFPPECFVPPTADQDDLERGESGDVYRLGALLYELSAGTHPIFPEDSDVASSVAALVTDVGRRAKPVETGSTELDALIMAAIGLSRAERPSWQTLLTALDRSANPVERIAAAGSAKTHPKPDQPRSGGDSSGRGLMTIPIRGASLALLAALACILIVLWTNRPATHAAVVVNSDPVGVTFELVQDDGSVVDLGRTPFILRDVGLGESVDIRPIYEDGAPGEIRSVAPDRLEVFDACRQLLVEFETNP